MARTHDSSGGGGHGHDEQKDKSKVKCYNYQELGHFAWECPEKNKKNEFALLVVASSDDEPALLSKEMPRLGGDC